ncbi:MAG: response regulator [Sedimenticola sp.]
MLEGDKARVAFDEFREVFGERETVLLFLSDEQLLRADNLAVIERTLKLIQAHSFVNTTSSLFSLKDVRVVEDGEVLSRPYLDSTNPPVGAKAMDSWLKHALSDPVLADQFISRDGKGMVVAIELTTDLKGATRDAEIVSALDRLVMPLKERLHTVVQVGPPILRQAVNDKVIHDQKLILPAALGLLLLLLALILRRPNGAIVPLATGTMSVIWTLGAMALLGIEINVMTSIVPALLIIIGSTEDIHLLAEYYAGRGAGLDKQQAIDRMGKRVGIAVLLTFLTTALGFLSIATNPIAILREFGLMAGFGLAANFLVTTLLVPAWMQLFSPGISASLTSTNRDNWIQGAAVRLMGWVLRSKRLLLWTLTGVLILSAAGALQIKVDNDPLGYFDEGDEIIRDRAILEDRLTGSHSFSIVLDAKIEETFLKVRYLETLNEIQRFIDGTGLFRKTFSFADIMAKINIIMEEDDSGEFYLPESDDIAQEYSLFLNEKEIREYVSADFSRARIVVRHTINGSHELGKTIAIVQDYLAKHIPRGVEIHITGREVMTKRAADYMALGQIISLALVFLVIWTLVATLFVNSWAGLIALVPNLIPVALLFGVMGWFGIALDTSTAMVAAIALGICVDDTMHFMVRFHRSNQGRMDALSALEDTVRHEAVPIFSTSLALTAGFSLLALSSFPPVANFGLLSAMVIVAALMSTFLITPVLLSSVRLVSLWDMLDLKLQHKIRESCRLFTGMKTSQIKKLILLSEIRDFEAGDTLFRQGESGHELFVVLAGRVEIWKNDQQGLRALAQLADGEIFGEMALIRSQRRSVSVAALNRTRVLVMRWDELQRIKRISPRIAARLFTNLSMVLGDRLDMAMASRDNPIHRQLDQELTPAMDLPRETRAADSQSPARLDHDLRDPLNAIVGLSDLMLKTRLDSQQRQYLSRMGDSVRSLSRTILTGLGSADTRRAGVVLQVVEFKLSTVLESVMEAISGIARQKGLAVRLNMASEISDNLQGDPLRLGQILLSLAHNAVRYTEEGEVRIILDAERLTSHTLVLHCSVQDTGSGMSSERLSEIMVLTPDTRQIDHGLGLAICRRLVELMHGEFSADSSPGVGSDFRVSVKLGQTHHGAEGLAPKLPASQRNLEVLVVDDNPLSREILINALAGLGLSATAVNSGEASLTAITERSNTGRSIDALILDWRMPGLDGIETARRVRGMSALPKQPAILLISAYSEDDPPAEQDLAGVIDVVLHKPVEQSTLYTTLVTLISGAPPVSASEQVEQTTATETSDFPSGTRILLAEDSFINQQMALEMLRNMGLEVIVAEDGVEVLHRLEENPVDGVLLDLEMPKMGGVEACQKLRADLRFQNLPVIAMTAHVHSDDEERCLKAGMNDFISKPIDAAVLAAVLRRWLVDDAPKEIDTAAASPHGASSHPGIDTKLALKHASGNRPLMETLLRNFMATNHNITARLGELLDEGRGAEAAAMTHTLKGEAGCIAATGVVDNSRKLERALKEEGDWRVPLATLDTALGEVLDRDHLKTL